jgi:hypothetical protein
VTANGLPEAISVIQRINPERGRAIAEHVKRVQGMINEAQQVQHAQVRAMEQSAQQQWDHFARSADDQYSAYAKTRPVEEAKAVRDNVARVLSSEYGLDERTLVDLYRSNPVVRSAAFQRMAHDLVAHHLAREGVAAKRDRSAPVVQVLPPKRRPAHQGKRRRNLGLALCVDDEAARHNRPCPRLVPPGDCLSELRNRLMETVFIQIRAPKGFDPGKVQEGHYKVIGDTVLLVDRSGKALASDDQKYSRKLTAADNPKQVAAQLLRQHYNATRTSPRGFNDKLNYPKIVY